MYTSFYSGHPGINSVLFIEVPSSWGQAKIPLGGRKGRLLGGPD